MLISGNYQKQKVIPKSSKYDRKVLIFSVDTDVKMLYIYWSARLLS